MATANKIKCPDCGIDMNYHAEKIDYSAEPASADPDFGGAVQEVHSCPGCGNTEVRLAP